MAWKNLDLECSKSAGEIAATLDPKKYEDHEKFVTEAGSVLAAQGIHALFLYLNWKRGKGPAEKTLQGLCKLLNQEVSTADLETATPQQLFDGLAKMTEDFERLLLARKLLSHTLTYLRYRLRAQAPPRNG